MSTQINLEDLRMAIEQVRPELPAILDKNYPAFAMELDSYLQMGSKNRLLDLFGRYPAAHECLRAVLAQPDKETTKGFGGLYGDINIRLYGGLYGEIAIFWHDPPYYHCERGSHIVAMDQVEMRDAAGRAICPQHNIVMSKASSEDVLIAIERLRPELPQILGADSSAFVTELNVLLPSRDPDQFGKLFNDHPAAYQRLWQILAQGPLAK